MRHHPHTHQTASAPLASPAPAARRARGFALIEALIALLIFSLGALGLLGLQVSMMKATSGAKYRADAAYLANDLVGTMWTDASNLDKYGAGCSGHPPCRNWAAKVQQALPQGGSALSVDTAAGVVTGKVDITITWTVPNEAQHSFNTSTSINP